MRASAATLLAGELQPDRYRGSNRQDSTALGCGRGGSADPVDHLIRIEEIKLPTVVAQRCPWPMWRHRTTVRAALDASSASVRGERDEQAAPLVRNLDGHLVAAAVAKRRRHREQLSAVALVQQPARPAHVDSGGHQRQRAPALAVGEVGERWASPWVEGGCGLRQTTRKPGGSRHTGTSASPAGRRRRSPALAPRLLGPGGCLPVLSCCRSSSPPAKTTTGRPGRAGWSPATRTAGR